MTGEVTRRRVVGALGAVGSLIALAPVRGAAAAERLVIPTYGGRYEKFWREQLLPPFEAKAGTPTVLDIGLGANFAAKLRATGPEHPPYSYLMANELVGAMLRAEGFFEAWPIDKVPNLKSAHPKANPTGEGVTVMFSPIGIAYRSDIVKTPPQSWKDLWDSPTLKGKVGLYQIDNTASYMFLMMISKIYGSGPTDFGAGFRQLEKLKPFPQAALAGALAVLLSRGEILAGPLDYGETTALKQKGVPVSWAAPAEGMFMFDQTFSLLKNAPNKDAACAFLDYMLSADVQRKLALEFSAVPVNRTVTVPPGDSGDQPLRVDDLDKIVTFDWVAANQLRDAVTERWNRITR
jgi:putative spermidine/putrescine transport system substrate-binding protein